MHESERSAEDILRGAVRVARHEGAITATEAERALAAIPQAELIAEVFARHAKRYGGRTSAIADELAGDMADALAETNPNFDRARFLKACGVEASHAN